ncbi:hypothetical protein BC826DRAFT_1188383 [Russula brevipes]|nr:hypothetical protein BC826DRAFT_1188383 [Russula brevipes]
MAVRVIRIIKQTTRDNAFDWTVTALKTVSDVSPIPPLTAAANVVLSILQIVSDVKTNRQGCTGLLGGPWACLLLLQTRMEGKNDAPKSLLDDIHEFEETLSSIYEYMCRLSEMNLIRRGLEKAKIQAELNQHEQELSWAEGRFQVSSGRSSNTPPRLPDQDQDVITNRIGSPGDSSSLCWSPLDPPVTRFEVVKRSSDHVGSPLPANAVYTEEEEFLANMSGDTDEFGFRTYHQSDVIIGNANRKAVGWFSGTSPADVCGRKATIKRYDGVENRTLKEWVRDIKMLRNLHHGNLPQIIGYSNRKTPTPFILLASVQNRDLDSVMRSVLTTGSLADCAKMILRTYRDVASAIAHVQRQLSLSEADIHHFIYDASYGVSNDNHVIVGLPRLREAPRWTYGRGPEKSLLLCVLRNLQELMDNETATLRVGPCQELVHFKKYRQLYDLLRLLLPREGEGLGLSPELEDLLDDADDHGPLNVSALRACGMHQLRSNRSWPASDAPLIQPLSAGDYGYIPGGSMDLAKFVHLGNIHDSEHRKEFAQVVGKAECKLFTSDHDPVIYHRSSPPMATSSISDERECWQIPLPLNGSEPIVRVSYEVSLNLIKHAREFLIAHGALLASKHEVELQDLILVTRSRRYYHYFTDGWSRLSCTRHAIELDSTASNRPASPVPVSPSEIPSEPSMLYAISSPRPDFKAYRTNEPVLPAEMLSEPSMLYLITSSRPDFKAYVTDEPLGALSQHPTNSSSSHCRLLGQFETVDYVQLDKEDIVS